MTRFSFDPEAIRILATILADTGLTEIEIEEKDSRIRLARSHAPIAAHIPAAAPPFASPPGLPAPAVPTPETEAADDAAHPGAVLSPMVGVVYLAPEPGAPPFVTVGQTVSAGQTLLLIEAMKTFNQIKATKGGTVARILVGSGTPVEYGEPLMVVE